MKKTLFLTAFIALSAITFFAQAAEDVVLKVKQKIYAIGDGGVVEVLPDPSGRLNLRILYVRFSDAPLKVRQRLNIDNQGGRFRGAMDKIRVRLFDKDGREMCKQFAYYNDFALAPTQEGDSVILLNFYTQCGKAAYEHLNNVTVQYY